jgi:calpain-7
MFPNGRDGIGPLMSSTRSVDLVQDAASDCSVVASLCAGIARAERGHDQVSIFVKMFSPSLIKAVAL